MENLNPESVAFEDASPAEQLARISFRLQMQRRSLLNSGGSVDWCIGAMQAHEQVRALRNGEKPLTCFRPAA